MFHLGIDDTDSAELGGCTTYLGAQIYLRIQKTNSMIILRDLPFLIRLNPNVPFRTKGNGSIIIRGLIHVSFISWFETTVVKFLRKFSKIQSENTNPGIVIWYGAIPFSLEEFGKQALWDIIDIREIDRFILQKEVFYYYIKEKKA